MKTFRERKLFKKLENRKNRIHYLKGIGEIVLPRIYSFRQKGNVINLLCDGEKVHPFCKDVTIETIKEYVLSHKVLENYCGANAGTCHQFRNCNECNVLHKKWALKSKEKGEKIVRPKPEEIEEGGETLIPIGSAIFSKRNYSGKWR